MISLVLTNRFLHKTMRIFHMEIVREKILPPKEMKFHNKRCPQGVCNHFVSVLFKCAFFAVQATQTAVTQSEGDPERKEAAKRK